jgi:6-phosphogluconolactonase (cycloisomerase 2 family)
MISRNNLLPTLLLVIGAVILVSCAPAVPCNIAGNARVNRLRPNTTTNICGNGGGGGTPTCSMTLKPTQVLLSVDAKGDILEYGIDSTTGALTLMCNTATAALGAIAVANNTFVYVLDQSKSPAQIFGFVIAHGNSGALAAITGSPFTLSEALPGNASLVADPLGRFMFVTNNTTGSGDVHVLTIGQSGALTEATGSPFPVSAPDFIAVNPAGTFAFVPDSTDGDIFIFSLDNNGKLTATTASPFVIGMGNNAAHFAVVHPNGNFLLTANQITLSSFSIDSMHAGALTQVGGSPFSPGGAGDAQVAPLTVTLDMSGKFLYVTPRGTVNSGIPGFLSENIVGYAFDTTGGGLTPVPMSPFISTSTLDLVANPLLEQMFFVTSNTTTILFDVAPIDASGNLTLPTTGLAVTAEIHPVVVNIN